MLVFVTKILILQSIPNAVILPPHEQTEDRAQKRCLARTVFRLNPESLSLAVDDALEDFLGVNPKRWREQVIGYRLPRLGLLDNLIECGCGLRLWLERQNFAESREFGHKDQA